MTPDDRAEQKRDVLAAAVVAFIATIPFLRMIMRGESLFFRDLSGQFLPGRRYVLEGILRGEWRFWNPLVHEGIPMPLLPFGYLPDLLQLLAPTESGISLFLCLHVPLAAVGFFRLARGGDLGRAAAAGGAFIYALGGFTLASLNLYVYVQTIAWAPFFVAAFDRAVAGGRSRAIALAAILLALMVSTTGVEIALQACLIAAVLSPPSTVPRFGRSAAVALLGLALSAAVVAPMLAIASNSQRGSGFATSVVLTNSVHPLAFAQSLVASFFGDVSNLTATWWGVNYFPRGFPYIVSLYLGPSAILLAAIGVASGKDGRRRLAMLALVGVLAALGKYAAWEWFFDLSASLRTLRYPVKAFYSIQFAVALLAAFALDAFANADRRTLDRIARAGFAVALTLGFAVALPALAPHLTEEAMSAFVPSSVTRVQRFAIADFVARDGATGGAVSLLIGVLAFLAARNRLPADRAAACAALLVAADLVRGGAGLNASVTQSFFSLSPEMSALSRSWSASHQRTFSCWVESSPTYWEGRRVRNGIHEVFTMAAFAETLTPDMNLPEGVRTALSIDRTMLVPTNRVMTPELAACRDFGSIVEPLRGASVERVLSLEPIGHPALTLVATVSPRRIAPLTIHVYALTGTTPRVDPPATFVRDESSEVVFDVDLAAPGPVVLRDPFAAGWSATLDGAAIEIAPTSLGHRRISVPAGRHRVAMRYEPPNLRLGLAASLLGMLACFGLALRRPDKSGSSLAPRESVPRGSL